MKDFYNSLVENKIFSYIAISFAIVSLALCSVWASKTSPNYLGVPSWKGRGKVSWHSVLGLAGFWFSISMANAFWSIFKERKDIGIFVHVFWHMAALSTLIASLIPIFQIKNEYKSPNLASIHGWIGISAASLYFFNISLVIGDAVFEGINNQLVSKYNVDYVQYRNAIRNFHKFVGLSVYVLVTATALMGITESQGSCGYSLSSADVNPSVHYDNLSSGCKVSNGLGITIMLTLIFVLASEFSRPMKDIPVTKEILHDMGISERRMDAPIKKEDETSTVGLEHDRELEQDGEVHNVSVEVFDSAQL